MKGGITEVKMIHLVHGVKAYARSVEMKRNLATPTELRNLMSNRKRNVSENRKKVNRKVGRNMYLYPLIDFKVLETLKGLIGPLKRFKTLLWPFYNYLNRL